MSGRSKQHADYLAAPPQRRWGGQLSKLRGVLEEEATAMRAEGQAGWAWRMLPRGACVAMRMAAGTWYVRISRRQRPSTSRRRAWAAELATFAQLLQLEGWTFEEEPAANGAAATFHRPDHMKEDAG